MEHERSPGIKLLLAGVVGAALIIPLMMVYWLVSDRQHQARIAQDSIVAGWAGQQTVSGPLIVVPYITERTNQETVEGKVVTQTYEVREMLYLSPTQQQVETEIDPAIRTRGMIYQSVVFDAGISGTARFSFPDDLDRIGVDRGSLRLEEAILQLPVSDPRGLQADARLKVGGEELTLRPGLGSAESGSGVHARLDWSDGEQLVLDFGYSLRGSSAFSFVPRGERTLWSVESTWPHPSFSGAFLPGESDREISEDGFKANWSVSNLALGRSLVSKHPQQMPTPNVAAPPIQYSDGSEQPSPMGFASIRLVEPVDLYKQVERALKYGFLFIGFTFLAFVMFDIIAGAKVALAEYLLTGVGLIMFFVMLLAFAELIGFALAYTVSSAAIIGLLTSYSAAVLGSWVRAALIGGLLAALYGVLYVLLNLESWSLMIGSVMLFIALAGVMYATRGINWSQVSPGDPTEPGEGEPIPA